MTSAQPDGRFGALDIGENSQVLEFKEKPKGDGSWINAGYFVCEPKVFDYILDGDKTIFDIARETNSNLINVLKVLIEFEARGIASL